MKRRTLGAGHRITLYNAFKLVNIVQIYEQLMVKYTKSKSSESGKDTNVKIQFAGGNGPRRGKAEFIEMIQYREI